MQMKIGNTINIEIVGIETFVSKIVDMNNTDIHIHFPQELNFFQLRPQHECVVSYIEEDVPYKFEATIDQYKKQDIPYIVLKMPELTNIERIQRREFVRVQTDADVAIYFENNQVNPIVTVTQDISGGGLRVVLQEALPFQTTQTAEMYLVLRYGQGKFEYICTRAKTVDSHLEKGVHTISMKFLLNEEKERQKIISYCFEIQRRNRKQELS